MGSGIQCLGQGDHPLTDEQLDWVVHSALDWEIAENGRAIAFVQSIYAPEQILRAVAELDLRLRRWHFQVAAGGNTVYRSTTRSTERVAAS